MRTHDELSLPSMAWHSLVTPIKILPAPCWHDIATRNEHKYGTKSCDGSCLHRKYWAPPNDEMP
jgi:hypothetical protein